MKHHNSQTKALTLCIAALALFLATACTKEYPIEYPPEGFRIISSDSCENDAPLRPSREFVQLANEQTPIKTSYPTDEYLRNLPGYDEARDAWDERIGREIERVEEVLDTYKERLERYPYYYYAYAASHYAWPEGYYFWDGPYTDGVFVEIHLRHLVDPRTVPPEDRMPSCIAGVPVHILVGAEFGTPESQTKEIK